MLLDDNDCFSTLQIAYTFQKLWRVGHLTCPMASSSPVLWGKFAWDCICLYTAWSLIECTLCWLPDSFAMSHNLWNKKAFVPTMTGACCPCWGSGHTRARTLTGPLTLFNFLLEIPSLPQHSLCRGIQNQQVGKLVVWGHVTDAFHTKNDCYIWPRIHKIITGKIIDFDGTDGWWANESFG